jgi:hypothetical protein
MRGLMLAEFSSAKCFFVSSLPPLSEFVHTSPPTYKLCIGDAQDITSSGQQVYTSLTCLMQRPTREVNWDNHTKLHTTASKRPLGTRQNQTDNKFKVWHFYF